MTSFPPSLRVSLPLAFLVFGLLAATLEYEQCIRSNAVREQNTAAERSARHSQRIASLAGILLPAGQQTALQQDIYLSARIPGAGPAAVCDDQGRILCAGDSDWIGRDYRQTPLKSAEELVLQAQRSGNPEATYIGDGRIQAVDTFKGGYAILEFDSRKAITAADHDARLEAFELAGGFAFIGLILWGFLHFSFATRIQRLVKEARAFAHDSSAVPKPIAGSDEIAELSHVFAQTGATLRERELALERVRHSLAEKNKELESVFYVASHDLRSPLVNVQGFSRDLLSSVRKLKRLLGSSPSDERDKEVAELLDSRIPEAVEFVGAGATKMDSLLKGLAKISRLGRAAIAIEPLDMNQLVANAAKAVEFQIQSIEAKIAVDPLPPARGDAVQISQVFSNLLDNAIKYRDRERSLSIHVSGKKNEDGLVIFRVTDNGRGIAKEHQTKIFEIFHRLDPHLGQGEGLGLTIAQRILDLNHGSIRVESEKGVGTTFLITLPSV